MMIYTNVLEPFFFSGAPSQRAETQTVAKVSGWTPAIDLAEKEDAYLLTADVPGVKFDEIDLSVEEGVLTLRGERKVAENEERTRGERRFGAFERSFTLPETADVDAVSAKYDLGVLAITIAKKAKPEARKIEIQH